MTPKNSHAPAVSRPNGWDKRDYELWSLLQQLPSYGLIAPDDRSISLRQVIHMMEVAAEKRFNEAWEARCQKTK
jgi:hypothetical protein